jgi:hypothetical protein
LIEKIILEKFLVINFQLRIRQENTRKYREGKIFVGKCVDFSAYIFLEQDDASLTTTTTSIER